MLTQQLVPRHAWGGGDHNGHGMGWGGEAHGHIIRADHEPLSHCDLQCCLPASHHAHVAAAALHNPGFQTVILVSRVLPGYALYPSVYKLPNEAPLLAKVPALPV